MNETLKPCPRPDCKGVGQFAGPMGHMTRYVGCSDCSIEMRTDEWQSLPRQPTQEPTGYFPPNWTLDYPAIISSRNDNGYCIPVYVGTPPDDEARRLLAALVNAQTHATIRRKGEAEYRRHCWECDAEAALGDPLGHAESCLVGEAEAYLAPTDGEG